MFKTINSIFSTKRDLLAIGLFVGAFIALMVFELFGWLFNSLSSQILPASSTGSAAVKFLTLLWQFFAIAISLFSIERLYNRFVRSKQKKGSSAEQLYNRFVNSDHLKYKAMTAAKEEAGTSLVLDDLAKSEQKNNDALGVEKNTADATVASDEALIKAYLKEHNTDSQDLSSQLKYERKEHLRVELARLLEPEKTLKDTVETLDLIDVLTQDFRYAASKSGKQVKDLTPEKIRSVLAKR